MALLLAILILIVWLIVKVVDAARPTKPPIKDIEAHTKTLMQMQPEERKNYIKKF